MNQIVMFICEVTLGILFSHLTSHSVHYIHEKPWSKRCKAVAYPNNLPDWHEVDVDPTHAWWWHTHDNYL